MKSLIPSTRKWTHSTRSSWILAACLAMGLALGCNSRKEAQVADEEASPVTINPVDEPIESSAEALSYDAATEDSSNGDDQDSLTATEDLETSSLDERENEVEEETLGLDMRQIHFDFDQAALRSEDLAILEEVAAQLRSDPDLQVVVEGYADSTGAQPYNQWLSQRRAEAVRNVLVDAGIPLKHIDIQAFGAAQPIASNATRQGRQQNRRVEIEFVQAPLSLRR